MKQRIFIALVCVYNVIAALMVISNMPEVINSEEGMSWHYVVLVFIPLSILLISTFGLWLKKKWAFITLIFLYLFQAYSYSDPEVTYLYFLGPHFFLEWSLNFPDGLVVQKFNLFAITILIFLVFIVPVPFPKVPGSKGHNRTGSGGER